VLLTKFGNQRGCDALCATAVGQHFAQHGPEAHDQREATERTAHTRFNGADYFHQRHTLHQADGKGHQHKGDKTVHFETDHQEE